MLLDLEKELTKAVALGQVFIEPEEIPRLVKVLSFLKHEYKIKYEYLGKSRHQELVELFMIQAGQEVPDTPTVPSVEVLKLRKTLIEEETKEVVEAIDALIEQSSLEQSSNEQSSLNDVASELADLMVVTVGTLSALGIKDDVVLLVDRNNLEKFGPGHSIREDGKLIKPPDFKKVVLFK